MRLADLIDETVRELARSPGGSTRYREPLIGVAAADDPRFLELRQLIDPGVLLPPDLLPGARSVVSFFLPFSEEVVEANGVERPLPGSGWSLTSRRTDFWRRSRRDSSNASERCP